MNNKTLIIYFICLIIILLIVKHSNNFSYVFIAVCLFALFIYCNQNKYNNIFVKPQVDDKNLILNNKLNDYIKELEIKPKSFITEDSYLIQLLYKARFIKIESPTFYFKLLDYINNFMITYLSLKYNRNNIFLKSTDLVYPLTLKSAITIDTTDMIKPIPLNKIQQSILINDLRDHTERILKHIQSIVFTLPSNTQYLDSFYEFSQLIRFHFTKYYNMILKQYNYLDHTSHYLLNRSSENKYDYIDW